MSEPPESLLTGRQTAPAPPRPLRAGKLSLLLVDGDLRTVTVGGVEVVRRIYPAIRDLDWNTIPGTIEDMVVAEHEGGFTVTFTSLHEQRELRLRCATTIRGTADGTIEYALRTIALSDFAYAKIGLCIHHPIVGFAGQAFTGRSPEGPVAGVLPDAIGPQIHLADGSDEPLFDPVSLLKLRHESGASVEFSFTGDLWEMEDQRNWSDASYKSASTPASLGYHHEAGEGTVIEQSIAVSTRGFDAVPDGGPRPVSLRIGAASGRRVPPIGLGLARVEHGQRALAAIRTIAPAHLRVDLALDSTRAVAALAAAADVARHTHSLLEVALMLPGALDAVAVTLDGLGSLVARILVFHREEESTSAASIDAVFWALGASEVPVISGTNIYFNELNRHRIAPGRAVGLAWSLNPQIHAFDELSIMENLQAQPDAIATARGFAQGADLYVTPVTLRPRFNAVAVTDDDTADASSGADPRQSTLFAAAWVLGSIAALAGAGADGVTYFETVGDRGVLDADGEPFPTAVVLADACGLVGAAVLEIEGVDPSRVAALAVRHGGITTLLVANLTRDPREITVHCAGSNASVRQVDTAGWSARNDLDSILAARVTVPFRDALRLTLQPYASTRADIT